MIDSALDLTILGPAFVAGLLVLLTHVPLGRAVLARGIIFLDLAVAQVAGLGVLVASSLHWDSPWLIQLSAVTAALFGAMLLYGCEKRWPDIQEALIGSIFVLTSCTAIILLSGNPHAGEALHGLLSGQILWTTPEQLWPLAVIGLAVLLIWWLSGVRRHPLLFYALFALAVTASVQIVGVYLVFASLIIPALAVRAANQRWQSVLGYGLGVIGYALGLIASALLDWPSGATIVWTLALVSVLFAAGLSWVQRSNQRSQTESRQID